MINVIIQVYTEIKKEIVSKDMENVHWDKERNVGEIKVVYKDDGEATVIVKQHHKNIYLVFFIKTIWNILWK